MPGSEDRVKARSARPIPAKQGVTEANVYSNVYHVLVAGMVVSTALFIFGVIRALIHPQFVPLTRRWILEHYHLRGVLSGLAHGDPTAIMLLATLILILTPAVRVLVSIHAFYVDRDYKYVIVTSIVFFVIILTVVLAQFGLK